MTIKNVQSYILHVRGAGSNFQEADAMALRRLERACSDILAGAIPKDPGVALRTEDPGGGGGPCEAIYIDVEVNVSASGLPEAQSRDD